METKKQLVALRLFAKALTWSLLWCCPLIVVGQDPLFSQSYINQNYRNPAFAGFTNDLSVALNTRMQYLTVPGVLLTNTISANIGCDKETRLGIGVIYYDHIEGEGLLHTSNFSGQFSANFPFKIKTNGNGKKRALLTAGLQIGLGQKYLNWGRLTFTDQYSAYYDGLVSDNSFITPQVSTSNVYLDAGAGMRGFFEYGQKAKPRYISFGASMFHLNRPMQTFLNSQLALQPRYSFYVFNNFAKRHKKNTGNLNFFTLGLQMDLQQGMRANTLSVYQEANNYVTFGLSYRRQNFINLDQNNDAIITHFLFSIKQWTIGASYDWTISSLGEEKTFGTAEIGFRYVFGGTNLCRKNKANCPIKGFEIGADAPKLGF